MSSCLAIVLVFLMSCVARVLPSAGDRAFVYQRCLAECMMSDCSVIPDAIFYAATPIPMRWLQWTCPDECRHSCMWITVKAYEKDGTAIQQFHGKWPFVRVFGIQEPASTLFSLLNALAYVVMLRRLRRHVSSKAPMYYMWHAYALVAINAWFWAVVFHTRDFQFTEKMDYFSAISLMLSSLFIVSVRVLGPTQWLRWTPVGAAILGFFVYHVDYLSTYSFDYGYNMKANVAAGALSSAAWVLWSLKVRQKQPYVWKAIGCILALNGLITLELCDFPPLLWTFDAHSLWHLGTAPIPFLWYSFVIDDCQYMLKQQEAAEVSRAKTGGQESTTTKAS